MPSQHDTSFPRSCTAWRQLWLATVFTLFPTLATATSPLLSPAALEAQTTALINAGDFAAAQALIDRTQPPAPVALLFQARLAKARGNHASALHLLHRAAELAPQDLHIQRELAHSLFLSGQHTEAARQLRQLLRHDRDPVLRASYRTILSQIHAAKPLSFALRLTAQPSTNINNGTSADQFETVLGDFVIDEDSRKTSGTGYTVAGQMRWQVPVSQAQILRFNATLSHSHYPSYQRLDKSSLDLSLGLRHHRSQRSWVEPRLIASATNTRDGSDYHATGLGFAVQHALTQNATLSGDISALQRHYPFQSHRNGPVHQLSLSWHQQLSPQSTVAFTIRGQHVAHRADHLAHRDLTVSTQWHRQIHPALRGSLTLSHGIRRYSGIAPLSRQRRREAFTAVSVALQSDHLALPFGIPELRCSAMRTHANVALYSYNSQSCGLSLTQDF